MAQGARCRYFPALPLLSPVTAAVTQALAVSLPLPLPLAGGYGTAFLSRNTARNTQTCGKGRLFRVPQLAARREK